MVEITSDAIKVRYIEAMGESLGTQFHALWCEVAWLHFKWVDYVDLFGTKPERIELLNKAAPAFFRLVQDSLFEDVMLHIARLTDPPKSLGKQNLSIQNLPELIDDPKTKECVVGALIRAKKESNFCRDWRNRHLAHKDLDLAVNPKAVPLEAASRSHVLAALQAIASVLNEVAKAYQDTTILFDVPSRVGGALDLLYVLDDGMRERAKREERLAHGEWSAEDDPLEL